MHKHMLHEVLQLQISGSTADLAGLADSCQLLSFLSRRPKPIWGCVSHSSASDSSCAVLHPPALCSLHH